MEASSIFQSWLFWVLILAALGYGYLMYFLRVRKLKGINQKQIKALERKNERELQSAVQKTTYTNAFHLSLISEWMYEFAEDPELIYILADCLDQYARIKAGKLDKISVEGDLKDWFAGHASVTQPDVIDESLEIDANIPYTVKGNFALTHILIENIFSCCRAFAKESSLTVGCWKDSAASSGQCWIAFSIFQTQAIVPEPIRLNVLDKYHERPESDFFKEGIDALRLLIARECIIHLNGKIEVAAEEGVGLECIFSIPFEIE